MDWLNDLKQKIRRNVTMQMRHSNLSNYKQMIWQKSISQYPERLAAVGIAVWEMLSDVMAVHILDFQHSNQVKRCGC